MSYFCRNDWDLRSLGWLHDDVLPPESEFPAEVISTVRWEIHEDLGVWHFMASRGETKLADQYEARVRNKARVLGRSIAPVVMDAVGKLGRRRFNKSRIEYQIKDRFRPVGNKSALLIENCDRAANEGSQVEQELRTRKAAPEQRKRALDLLGEGIAMRMLEDDYRDLVMRGREDDSIDTDLVGSRTAEIISYRQMLLVLIGSDLGTGESMRDLGIPNWRPLLGEWIRKLEQPETYDQARYWESHTGALGLKVSLETSRLPGGSAVLDRFLDGPFEIGHAANLRGLLTLQAAAAAEGAGNVPVVRERLRVGIEAERTLLASLELETPLLKVVAQLASPNHEIAYLGSTLGF